MIPSTPAFTSRSHSAGAFTVRELPGGTADLTAAVQQLDAAARRGVAFLVAGDGRAALLTDPDPAQLAAAMAGQPGLWERLPAAVLQDLLMDRMWQMRDDEATVRVIHDPETALRAAAEAPGTTTVLCSPMTAADVYEVAAMGRIVPRKSTSFGPKPRTGLVIRTFAQG